MAGKRIAVVDADGQFGTIDEEYAHEIEASGGRVLGQKEVAQRAVDERYDALPMPQKVLGAVNTAAGALTGNPLLIGGDPSAPPSVAEYGAGVRQGMTAGLYDAGMRKVADAVGGKEAGDTYALRRDQETEASPVAHALGNIAGMTGGALLGTPGAGAARALPSAALGTAGNLLEHGIAKALGASAARSVLGRAAVTGATMAVRGAVEGGAYAGLEQAASNVLHNRPDVGEKLYTAFGHGALEGGMLGLGLGTAGSLAASGWRAAKAAAAEGLLKGTRARAPQMLPTPDFNAGLHEPVPHEAPIKIGSAKPGGGPNEVTLRGLDEVPTMGAPGSPGVPSPIKLPKQQKLGLANLLSQPEDAARALAADQAWNAVGAGFGLQSPRYARQAQKYFPEGTRDLGRTALQYNLIDIPHGESPAKAAFQAAKTGTPEHILPKAEAALDWVGQRIGDITERSGARVDLDDVSSRIWKVREQYNQFAGNEHVVSAIDNYHAGLRSRLGADAGSSARVQDFLAHRKDLDRIVYEEAKTLDPKGRVAALRQVRAEMEDAVEAALDSASGRVKGELRGDYERWKRDYHKLSILRDAAEDSAGRSAKHATFGLGEKFAMASAVASGHFTAAPVLGLAGKVIKERGNAALAAFLSRAADQQMFSQVLGRIEERTAKAARGVLRQPKQSGSSSAPTPSPRQAAKQAEDSQKAIATSRKRAQGIVQWVADVRANPKQFLDRVTEAGELVTKAAGSSASTAYTMSALKAFQFISSFVPVKERRDPLDPRSVPPLTLDEADRLVRATKYALRPLTVWDDFDRGIVTQEGIQAANDFMPEQFSDFRMRLHSYVTEHMLRNKQLTQSQRLRIDKLLDAPAGADLRPEAIARYQQNFLPVSPPDSGLQPAGSGPVNMKIQQSGFDSVEARQAS